MPRTAGLVAALALLPLLAHAAPRRLAVDETASKLTFSVRATMHSFTGTVNAWSAEIDLEDDSDRPTSAVFHADVATMKTGKDSRDRELLHWIGNEEFPTIDFQLTGFEGSDDAVVANGTLTIHGVAKAIAFPVTLKREGDRFSASGAVEVDHREYGLKPIRKMGFLTVSPLVKVAFELSGTVQ